MCCRRHRAAVRVTRGERREHLQNARSAEPAPRNLTLMTSHHSDPDQPSSEEIYNHIMRSASSTAVRLCSTS